MDRLTQQFKALPPVEAPVRLHHKIMSQVLWRRHLRRVLAYHFILVCTSMVLAISATQVIESLARRSERAIDQTIRSLTQWGWWSALLESLPRFSSIAVLLSLLLLLYCLYRLVTLYNPAAQEEE